MIRNDFVSNSSSSSFIVSEEDNKYDVILHDEYNILTLKKYIEHYFHSDCFYHLYSDSKIEDFNFVSDDVFNNRFQYGIRRTLPESCRTDMELYLEKHNNRPNYNSDECKKWSDDLDAIYGKIKQKVYKSLCLKWKKTKFHCSNISDNQTLPDRADGIWNQEELVEERLNYIDSIKSLKFRRIFCYH